MNANTKQLKYKINKLHFPWWFNLVKLGIPYTVALATAISVILLLGGWVAMPEAVPLLQWVEALFMAMQPLVRGIVVSLMGFGSFLSSLVISSVIVRGFLFSLVEKTALDSLEAGAQLLAQVKELKSDLLIQVKLYEQNQEQLEFLKGYATALNGNSEKVQKLRKGEEDQDQKKVQDFDSDSDSDQEENLLSDSEVHSLSKPRPVVFRKSPSKRDIDFVLPVESLNAEPEKQDKIAIKA